MEKIEEFRNFVYGVISEDFSKSSMDAVLFPVSFVSKTFHKYMFDAESNTIGLTYGGSSFFMRKAWTRLVCPIQRRVSTILSRLLLL